MTRKNGGTATIVAFICALVSTTATAQLKNDDILGIKPGMTVDQARTAIKSQNPAMVGRDLSKYPDLPGLPGPVFAIEFCERVVNNGCTSGDSVRVFLGEATHKILLIHRSVKFINPKVLVKTVKDSLNEKYGLPAARSGDGLESSWHFDRENKINPACAINAWGNIPEWGPPPPRGMWQHPRANPACGTSLDVLIEKDSSDVSFASGMFISIYDYRLMNEDFDKAVSIVVPYKQEKEREAKLLQQNKENEATANKPKL